MPTSSVPTQRTRPSCSASARPVLSSIRHTSFCRPHAASHDTSRTWRSHQTCLAASAVATVSTQTSTPTNTEAAARVSQPAAEREHAQAAVVQLDPDTFHSFLQGAGDNLVLVDYYTEWCGPCKLMHAEMDKLTRAFPRGVLFCKFDCGPHSAFSTQQRIRSLPTFRLFQRGRLLDQLTGAKPVQLRQLLTHYYRPPRQSA